MTGGLADDKKDAEKPGQSFLYGVQLCWAALILSTAFFKCMIRATALG